jgi:hypothetical protein
MFSTRNFNRSKPVLFKKNAEKKEKESKKKTRTKKRKN